MSYNLLTVSSVIVKLSLNASGLSQGVVKTSDEFIDPQRECVFMVYDFGIH
jgi:hypothetical protein